MVTHSDENRPATHSGLVNAALPGRRRAASLRPVLPGHDHSARLEEISIETVAMPGWRLPSSGVAQHYTTNCGRRSKTGRFRRLNSERFRGV
jgi:hypothetical protein